MTSKLVDYGALKAHVSAVAQRIDDHQDREFDFTDTDFIKIKAMIYRLAGISLNDTKKSMVYSRLSRRLRTLNLSSFSVYLQRVESGNSQETEEFINALTTNLTSFYREEHHFPVLIEYLQKLAARKKETLNIWCSAASTGEEPYTLAMSACEAFGTLTPPVKILASDIDTKVLQTAAAGVYKEESVEKISPALLKKYFYKGTGSNEGTVRVRPELTQMISFRQINLLDITWPVRAGFDVIFCRNVMIYFDKETQLQILNKFAPLLNPTGLLFAGHSENFSAARDQFRLIGKTVYEVISSEGRLDATHSRG